MHQTASQIIRTPGRPRPSRVFYLLCSAALILIRLQRATNFGLRQLDAAFLDATCRVIPKRRHVRAVQVKKLLALPICCVLNARWYQTLDGSSKSGPGVDLRSFNIRSGKTQSLPVTPLHVREKIVAGFDLVEPFFVHARLGQLFVQRDETQQMVLHPTAGVIGTRPGA